VTRPAPWTRYRPTPTTPQPVQPEPVIGHAVLTREDVAYRYPEPAESPAERLERLAASGYPGASTPDEEHLVQTWIFTGMVNGQRRVAFRPAR